MRPMPTRSADCARFRLEPGPPKTAALRHGADVMDTGGGLRVTNDAVKDPPQPDAGVTHANPPHLTAIPRRVAA